MTKGNNAVTWNPADYAANSSAQFAWARELLARLDLRGDERVLDVGCGDGKITAELAGAAKHGEVIGVDSSSEMLRFARAAFPSAAFPNLCFQRMDARRLHFARPFDLVFSNATLHWVDDHPAFLRGAASCLKAGGRLVASCGGKGNAQDVLAALRATMRTKRWRDYFRLLPSPYFFHTPGDYKRWLPRFRFEPQRVRLVNKFVAYSGPENFAAWLRTTWLPYTQRVPLAEREAFIADMVERFVARHPLDSAGKLTVRMVRLEIDAVKIRAPGTARACAETSQELDRPQPGR